VTPPPAPSSRPGPAVAIPEVVLVELKGSSREQAVPAIRDGFVGIYRWHAKRTLRDVPIVRAAESAGRVVGVALLDLLAPEVGYVYYIAVLTELRRTGVGGRMLEDALALFRARQARVVYAAAQAENLASIRLFTRGGFRTVERKETGWRDGGLGAWGLRSRMRLVPGEVLLGLRLDAPYGGPDRIGVRRS
jgi:L-amino acid N-acyltransferase YncA